MTATAPRSPSRGSVPAAARTGRGRGTPMTPAAPRGVGRGSVPAAAPAVGVRVPQNGPGR